MRILHIVHQYPPHDLGGTELYTQQTASLQATLGHDVTVLYPAPIKDTLTEQVDQTRVVRFANGQRSRGRIFIDSFRTNRALAQTISELLAACDIVHIEHLMGLPVQIIDQIIATGIPYIVTLHDYWFMCANAQLIRNDSRKVCAGPDADFHNCGQCFVARGNVRGAGFGRIAAPLLRYRFNKLQPILSSAAAVIAPTHFVADTFRQSGYSAENLHVIQHGLDIPAALPPRSTTDSLHIAYIGSIAWQKGLHILIDAVNKLAEHDIKVSIAGNTATFPEYSAQLQADVRHPGIHFTGTLSRDAVWQLLATVDAVVLPTLWYETSSLILDEANAIGVPVIASNIGVMPEKIMHEHNGLLFEVGDADALAGLLIRMVNSAELRSTLAARVPQVQTISQHVQRIQALYDEVVTSS